MTPTCTDDLIQAYRHGQIAIARALIIRQSNAAIEAHRARVTIIAGGAYGWMPCPPGYYSTMLGKQELRDRLRSRRGTHPAPPVTVSSITRQIAESITKPT